jgi:hypothetical protein
MDKHLNRLGHVGYAFIALGTFCIANNMDVGWPLRLTGTLTWTFIGWRLKASSIYIWAGLVFVPIEVLGWLRS